MFWICVGHVLDMIWASCVHVMGICWACFGYVMGIRWDMLDVFQACVWDVFVIVLHIYIFSWFSLNIMMRVSFSPSRDRACRHCWTPSFWTPEKTVVIFLPSFSKNTLENIWKQFLQIVFASTIWKCFDQSKCLRFRSKASCGGVLMVSFKLQKNW